MNRVFDSLEELKEVICERCRQLINQPEAGTDSISLVADRVAWRSHSELIAMSD